MSAQDPGVASAGGTDVESVARLGQAAELLGEDAAPLLIPPIPVLNLGESYQFSCFHDANFYHVLC